MTEPTPAELQALLGDLESLDGLFGLVRQAEERRSMRIWVTSKNMAWASEMSGLPLEEIERLYAKAREEKVICKIEVPNG